MKADEDEEVLTDGRKRYRWKRFSVFELQEATRKNVTPLSEKNRDQLTNDDWEFILELVQQKIDRTPFTQPSFHLDLLVVR